MKLNLKPGMAQRPRQVVDKLANAVRRKINLGKFHLRGKPVPLRKGPPEALLGFGRFVANPRRFGGFVSGPALAAAITAEIDPAAGPVLELGPGTGVFTRALLARGVAERDLVLVELDQKLAARLRIAFPQALVLCCKAGSVTAEMLEGRRPAAVVSGLPLLNFPDEEVERIITATFAVCTSDTALYQFTYGPKCPVNKDIRARLGLTAQRTTRIWRNVPPASVYRIIRN
ncbi:SAM-dependent methyltransferase [Novosphingobium sediminis]|uniref:SAM-dependent methyltransferase n=1 Tax=Novosphingobium sediminis TaxID=707214 RepID=A0A512AHX6_9SPHN|nr:rRNA adenine N-6-methyltransferase family protein [Novosphingobium sediminis]GEN99319.1 SAM-dependent methyltransferase [Novosphingobium sediminis]